MRRALLLPLLLLTPPTAQGEPPSALGLEGLAAGPPDADLKVPLRAIARADTTTPFTWSLAAQHTPANASEALRWEAGSGEGVASSEGGAWNASFRARYGTGRYVLTLTAAAPPRAPASAVLELDVPEVRTDAVEVDLAFEVPPAPGGPPSDAGDLAGGVPLVLEVPADAPTTLRFASDAVNADGKAKAPGSALLTRVVLADPDGLRDVARVTFTYARNDSGHLVTVEQHAHEAFNATATQAALEDRFDTSPMRDGAYVCTVRVEGRSTTSVSRTFLLLDTAPDTQVALASASVLPGPTELTGTVLVRDANLGTGPLDPGDVTALGSLRLTLYRGSAKVADEGWALAARGLAGAPVLDLDLREVGTRSAGDAYRAAGGKGEVAVPFTVQVPEGAAAGTYRVSAAAQTAVSSASFEVLAPPRVTRFELHGEPRPGGSVAFEAAADALRNGTLELRTPWGEVRRPAPEELADANGTRSWRGSLALPPALDDDQPLEVVLVALPEGRGDIAGALPSKSARLTVANTPPRLAAELRIGGARIAGEAWVHPLAARELELAARGEDDNAQAPDLRDELGDLEVEVRDWSGRPAAWNVTGSRDPANASLRLEPPAGAERGRYTVTVRARDDDGEVAERTFALHLGTRFRLGIAAPAEGLRLARDPDGRFEGTVEVRNLGNAPAAGFAVLVQGLPANTTAEVRLGLPDGTWLNRSLEQGFARFGPDAALGVGGAAQLRIALTPPPDLAPGVFRGHLRIAGEAT